jgi:ADP-glucose pyrophosphorylase
LLQAQAQAQPKGAGNAQISADSIVATVGVTLGERASVKRSVLAKHVSVGKMAKLTGSVLMEGAVVGERCAVVSRPIIQLLLSLSAVLTQRYLTI